jgi:hypothetical protein
MDVTLHERPDNYTIPGVRTLNRVKDPGKTLNFEIEFRDELRNSKILEVVSKFSIERSRRRKEADLPKNRNPPPPYVGGYEF